MNHAHWPALPYEWWKHTYATLHMWTQIVGKVALAQGPPINHCWGVAMHVTPRGLATRTLAHGDRSFDIEFDFIDHQLWVRPSDRDPKNLPLTARPVSQFYSELMDLLRDMQLPVRIWSMPVEVPNPIRFEHDIVDHHYDHAAANTCWRILSQVDRVFTASRCNFIGKCSPVQFFWGSFDVAVTRFSGRRAPAREGPAFMRDAYSHEVISHGSGLGVNHFSHPRSTRMPSPNLRG